MPKDQTNSTIGSGVVSEQQPQPEKDKLGRRRSIEQRLDYELEQTFPASDPLTITRKRFS